MKRTVWSDDGVVLIESERPQLRPGWARLRVAACGICGSDLHVWHQPHSDRPKWTPGHEICGYIEDGPAGLRDCLYAVEPCTCCGECQACKRGERALCAKMGLFGFAHDGGLAEQVDAPVERLHPVSGISKPSLAALAEPVAVAVRGCNVAAVKRGERLLVIGAGTIGLLSGLIARERGAEVSIVSRYEHQSAAAAALGLTPVEETDLAAFTEDTRPGVVLESVGGAGASARQAISSTASGGRVVLLGIFTAPVRLDLLELVTREVDVLGSLMYGEHEGQSEFASGVDVLERHADVLAGLVTHEFPLAQVRNAFECALDKGSASIKVSVTV